MFNLFRKGVAGFPPWCIGFTFLYILFYFSWILDYRQKFSYPPQQVTYNITHSHTKIGSCHDPVYFIFPCQHKFLRPFGRLLQKNLINSYGFKNTSCSKVFNMNRIVTAFCAKYNRELHSNEFCNGGEIIWQPQPNIFKQFTKSKLNKILTKYCNIYHATDNICNFKLLTFNMDNLQQRIEFITKYINCTNNNSQPNKTWLFKELKHEGNGIHFYNNHQIIYSLIGPNEIEEKKYYNKCINISTLQMVKTEKYFENKGFDYTKRNANSYKVNYNGLTMQEFISNPLLIENKAFHIRTLVLIASTKNPLIVLQYPKWQIFRNPLQYNNSDLDPLKLKSNSHIANMSPNKLMDDNGTILFQISWGYNRFQKYLNEKYNDINLETKMQNDMKSITTTVFNAHSYHNKLDKLLGMNENKTFDNILRFDIACMDTVMNNKFELKFLEINFWCGYYCGKNGKTDSVGDDDQFCDMFANETSDILMEIYGKQKNGIDIKNINSLNKFEIIHLEK